CDRSSGFSSEQCVWFFLLPARTSRTFCWLGHRCVSERWLSEPHWVPGAPVFFVCSSWKVGCWPCWADCSECWWRSGCLRPCDLPFRQMYLECPKSALMRPFSCSSPASRCSQLCWRESPLLSNIRGRISLERSKRVGVLRLSPRDALGFANGSWDLELPLRWCFWLAPVGPSQASGASRKWRVA